MLAARNVGMLRSVGLTQRTVHGPTCWASSSAVAAPMPLLAPVMTAAL